MNLYPVLTKRGLVDQDFQKKTDLDFGCVFWDGFEPTSDPLRVKHT
jgi:hypothetical protein